MATLTGEVFRTHSPADSITYWRMFQGGLGAGNERGRFYAEPNLNYFNIDAPAGAMHFQTNNLRRMGMNETGTRTINSFTNQHTSGYVGISAVPAFFTSGNGPFSRLHLVDSVGVGGGATTYAQQFGYRPWMRNGVTMTGNSDQAYFGQKYRGPDSTDVVFQWSDNPGAGSWTPDHLRFLFTSDYSAGRDTGCKSMEGLEAMRMYPVDSFNVNIGIGDFYKAGVLTATPSLEPEERLDIVDGRVRIRQLPYDASVTEDKVMVVDDDGVVHWRPFTDFSGATDCDWFVHPGTSAGDNYVITAVDPVTPGCPDETEFVGIGVYVPVGKLHVQNNATNTSGNNFGTVSELPAVSGTGYNYGVSGSALGAGTEVHGVAGHSQINGTTGLTTGTQGSVLVSDGVSFSYAIGASGTAISYTSGGYIYGTKGYARTYNDGGAITTAYGAYGEARGDSIPYTSLFGVYGNLSGVVDPLTDYAVFANGRAGGTSLWITSDASVKTNIEPLENAMETLSQLEPKTYEFRTNEFPELHLDHGPQMGLDRSRC